MSPNAWRSAPIAGHRRTRNAYIELHRFESAFTRPLVTSAVAAQPTKSRISHVPNAWPDAARRAVVAMTVSDIGALQSFFRRFRREEFDWECERPSPIAQEYEVACRVRFDVDRHVLPHLRGHPPDGRVAAPAPVARWLHDCHAPSERTTATPRGGWSPSQSATTLSGVRQQIAQRTHPALGVGRHDL